MASDRSLRRGLTYKHNPAIALKMQRADETRAGALDCAHA
jgi:hypothetical protein